MHVAWAIPNTTDYEWLVTANPVQRESIVDAHGMAWIDSSPGIDPRWEADALHRQAVEEI